MPYVVGVVLALLTFAFLRVARLDRDRSVYVMLVVVVASYYVLFAAMAGSMRVLVIESAVTMVFAIIAVIGFNTSLWLVAAALAGHGVFDSMHGSVVSNPGVPVWWPAFCGSFDVAIGICFGWLLYRTRGRTTTSR